MINSVLHLLELENELNEVIDEHKMNIKYLSSSFISLELEKDKNNNIDKSSQRKFLRHNSTKDDESN